MLTISTSRIWLMFKVFQHNQSKYVLSILPWHQAAYKHFCSLKCSVASQKIGQIPVQVNTRIWLDKKLDAHGVGKVLYIYNSYKKSNDIFKLIEWRLISTITGRDNFLHVPIKFDLSVWRNVLSWSHWCCV